MGNFLVTIFKSAIKLISAYGNANESSTSLASATGNPARLLHRATLPVKRHIKKLSMLHKNPKTELWFEDECHFQQHGSRCRMWIPPENHDPVLLHAPTRKSISVFGAVCSSDGRFSSMTASVFNAATFLLFLKRLIRRKKSRKKIVLVLDNARWHHAKDIKPWLYKHRKFIKLFFLPPYSPHLNPIERVWKLTRYNVTHNRYFKELSEVNQVVQSQFKRWHKPNKTLTKLCAII